MTFTVPSHVFNVIYISANKYFLLKFKVKILSTRTNALSNGRMQQNPHKIQPKVRNQSSNIEWSCRLCKYCSGCCSIAVASVVAMTPARTLTLALICARAFTLDLNIKEHNCTVSNEDKRICNAAGYGDDELSIPIDETDEVKLKSNHSKERNYLDVIFIEDDQNVRQPVSLSEKKYEINNSFTNINQTGDNHNWTNDQGRYIYDQNPQKLNENIFGHGDDLQAYYLAVSEHNGKGNIRKAFDETLFSDIPDEDIIYELSGMYCY